MSDLAAWTSFYDNLGGSSWTICDTNRVEPCTCSFVTCVGGPSGQITEIDIASQIYTGTELTLSVDTIEAFPSLEKFIVSQANAWVRPVVNDGCFKFEDTNVGDTDDTDSCGWIGNFGFCCYEQAQLDLFDSTTGDSWTDCSSKRESLCTCNVNGDRFVDCTKGVVTTISMNQINMVINDLALFEKSVNNLVKAGSTEIDIENNPTPVLQPEECAAFEQCELPVECFLPDIPTCSPTTSPTQNPTKNPSQNPTQKPSQTPTRDPTQNPTKNPTTSPTQNPTSNPSMNPTKSPTKSPSKNPTVDPTQNPTKNPTTSPTKNPTVAPSQNPSKNPTVGPTQNPTIAPSKSPSKNPTISPSKNPTSNPSMNPTKSPTKSPSKNPTVDPTQNPTRAPSHSPSKSPSMNPTTNPTLNPSVNPSKSPTINPTLSPLSNQPSISPSANPTQSPSKNPSLMPSRNPSRNPSLSPSKSPTSSPTISPTEKSCNSVDKQRYHRRVTCESLSYCIFNRNQCIDMPHSCSAVNVFSKPKHFDDICKLKNCIIVNKECKDKPSSCTLVNEFSNNEINEACDQIDDCKYVGSTCQDIPAHPTCLEINYFFDGFLLKKSHCENTQGCVFSKRFCQPYPTTCVEVNQLDRTSRTKVCPLLSHCQMVNRKCVTSTETPTVSPTPEADFTCESVIQGLTFSQSEKACANIYTRGCQFFFSSKNEFDCKSVLDEEVPPRVSCAKINDHSLKRTKRGYCLGESHCEYDAFKVNSADGKCFEITDCESINNFGRNAKKRKFCRNDDKCIFNEVNKLCQAV